MSRLALMLALLLPSLVGCATSRMPAKTATALQEEKAASIFYMPRKAIDYSQLVYKVLYNETRTHHSTFEGLWDVDAEYSEHWNAALNDVGIKSKKLADLLDERGVERVNEALTKAFPEVPMELPGDLLDELSAKGVTHVVALKGGGFRVNGNTFGGGLCQLYVPLTAVVYDVRARTQVHEQNFTLLGNVTVEDSLRDFEANDLALLKQKMKDWFEERVRPALRTALDAREKKQSP